MSPPTEQLIRDYLNRLSVAARGRLAGEDRQALVMSTRDFIERTAAASDAVTPMEVAALLSRLGDPATRVDQEVARLATARGEPVELAPEQGRRPGRLLRRRGQASWHLPSLAGSPVLRLVHGQAGQAASSAGGAEPAGGSADGVSAEPREPPIWVPRQPSSPESEADEPEPGQGEPTANGRPSWPSVVAMNASGADTSPETGEPDERAAKAAGEQSAGGPARLDTDGRPVIPPRLTQAARAFLELVGRHAREHPVEAAAEVLLGLGGAAFPPVWLLGVVVALASRVWDYRDKWIGLAGPVLLLVVGTVVGVSLGSQYPTVGGYLHETWVYADILSRVAAVLGAAYLAWRVARRPRGPRMPPWNKPHKVG